jgi:hypothetical protein
MVQAVCRRPLTAEARVRAQVSLLGVYGIQSGNGIGFSVLLLSPVNIIPPWLFILIYHLGDEQQARWWLQFRDMVSPLRQEQHEEGI